MTSKIIELTRKGYNLIAKNIGIQEPQNMFAEELNTLSKYDNERKIKSNRRKLLKIKLEKLAQIQNIWKVEKLQNKSIDELRGIARWRRIENYDNLTKEDLIISLLKSESNPEERNYMEYVNNSTHDYTYDDKIKGEINDIRIILSRLGNRVSKDERKRIKKELYETEKKQSLSDNEKEEIYVHFVELVKTFDKEEELSKRSI